MDKEKLMKEISKLEKKLSTISLEANKAETNRNTFNAKVKEINLNLDDLFAEKDNIFSEFGPLNQKIAAAVQSKKKHWNERDRINLDVKAIWNKIGKFKNERESLEQEEKRIKRAIAKKFSRPHLQKRNLKKAKELLRQLEFQQQSQALEPKDEKALVEKIKQAHGKIGEIECINEGERIEEIHARKEEINSKIYELLSEKDKAKKDSQKNHEAGLDRAREIRAFNKTRSMLSKRKNVLFKEIKKLKKKRESVKREADSLHKNFIKLDRKRNYMMKDLDRLYAQLRKIKEDVREGKSVLKKEEAIDFFKKGGKLVLGSGGISIKEKKKKRK